MKKHFAQPVLGLSIALAASGCLSVRKDPRHLLGRQMNGITVPVVLSDSIEVPAAVPSPDPAPIADEPPVVLNPADPAPAEETPEVIAEIPVDRTPAGSPAVLEDAPVSVPVASLEFDSGRMESIAIYAEGGSFDLTVRDHLASGALVSSDDQVSITGDVETDLRGLDCQLIADDVVYGLHCTYDGVNGSAVGDQFHVRFRVANAGGAETDDYVTLEVGDSGVISVPDDFPRGGRGGDLGDAVSVEMPEESLSEGDSEAPSDGEALAEEGDSGDHSEPEGPTEAVDPNLGMRDSVGRR